MRTFRQSSPLRIARTAPASPKSGDIGDRHVLAEEIVFPERLEAYDVAALKGDIVDKVSAAIMMIDRDFVVTYVNGPTRELLTTEF